MTNIYYKEVACTEEMLFDVEIARIYRLYRVTDSKSEDFLVSTSPYGNLVETIINEYIKENKIEVDKLFFYNKSGFARVYPKDIYDPALKAFIELYECNIPHLYKLNNRIYRFIYFGDTKAN